MELFTPYEETFEPDIEQRSKGGASVNKVFNSSE